MNSTILRSSPNVNSAEVEKLPVSQPNGLCYNYFYYPRIFFLSLWTCFLGRIDILKLKKKITLNVTECSAHMLSTCSPQMSILKLWSHCVCIWVCLIHSDETV